MDAPYETSQQQETKSAGGVNNPQSNTSGKSNASNLPSSLLTCSFNQDGGCLAIGTTNGFSVHNLHPSYSLSVERTLRGGIGLVEMLFRCNLMALVGGGPTPHGAPHRVLIWDDHIPKEIGELSFRQSVLRVKLRKDAIAVALRDRVYVYQLADLSLRDKIYTADNPHGLLTVSTHVQDMVLACPSVTTGHVRVELYGLRKTVLIEAHDSSLRALALTAAGDKLATASMKGTILRVFNVATATCIQEFRRGVERATITCLAWSYDCSWLSCTSDKGTAHVFWLGNNNSNGTFQDAAQSFGDNAGSNNHHSLKSKSPSSPANKSKRSSSTSLVKGIFSSVKKTVAGSSTSHGDGDHGGSKGKRKSVCQVRGIPHPLACSFCADGPANILAVAGYDADGNGVLLLSEFAANQEARRVAYHVLTKSSLLELERHSGIRSFVNKDGILDDAAATGETEEERRRRRLRGWTPTVPPTPAEGRLLVGDRLDTLENGMEQIQFIDGSGGNGSNDGDDDDDFVQIITPTAPICPSNGARTNNETIAEPNISSTPPLDDDTGIEGSTNADSIQTEPLDDDDENVNVVDGDLLAGDSGSNQHKSKSVETDSTTRGTNNDATERLR